MRLLGKVLVLWVLVGCGGGGDQPACDPDTDPECQGSGSGSGSDCTPSDPGYPDCTPVDTTDGLDLDVVVVPDGGGTVTASPGDKDGAVDPVTTNLIYLCTLPLPVTVTLTAAPAPGYAFAGWSGDCQGLVSQTAVDLKHDADNTCKHMGEYSTTCTATFVQVSQGDQAGDSQRSINAGDTASKIAAAAVTETGKLEIGAAGTVAPTAILDAQTMLVSQQTLTRGAAGELRIGSMLITSAGLRIFGGQATVSGGLLQSAFWATDSTGTPMNANLDMIDSASLIGITDTGTEVVAGGNNELYLLSRTTGALSSALVLHGNANDPIIRKIVAGPAGSMILIGSLNNNFWVAALDANHALVFSKTYAGTVATGLWNGASVVGGNVIVGAQSKGFTSPDYGIVLASISLTTGDVTWATALSHSGTTAYFGSVACTATDCFVGGALGAQALIATCDPATGGCASFLGFDSATSNTVVTGMTVVGTSLCGWEDFGLQLFCMPMANLGLGTCSSPMTSALSTPFTATSVAPTVADAPLTIAAATTTLVPMTLTAAADTITLTQKCTLP